MAFGRSWGALGVLLGALGGFSDRSWVDLGRSWVTLSILGAILGALGFS